MAMATALLLVKFPDDSIYIGCYMTISDWAYDWIETPEEILKYEWRHLDFNQIMTEKYPNLNYGEVMGEITDEVEVDIYTDYGGGFYWKGKASKEKKIITDGHTPLEEMGYDTYESGTPEWAKTFLTSYYEKSK